MAKKKIKKILFIVSGIILGFFLSRLLALQTGCIDLFDATTILGIDMACSVLSLIMIVIGGLVGYVISKNLK